jgi:enterochelin esterase-like enzyme
MLFTAALLVLAAPVVTHMLWTRVRGPRPVRLATRLSMIGVCQVTAILLGFIIVNNHYNFYSSWDDLLGDDAGPGVITHQSAVDGPHRGGHGPGPRVRPDGPAQDFEPAGGGALAATFRGPLTGLSSHDDVYVWLPPQYSDPAYAKSSFPVVMLFPGFPGTPQTWFGAMAGQEALLKQLRTDPGATTPFVLAAVNINMEKGVNTNCTDIPGGPQVASFITQDVRPMLERSFRVMTDRRGWGLMGYSEGGLCAGKLLVQYPQDFSAAVQMSGDVRPDGVVTRYGERVRDENSTLWLFQHRKPSLPVALLAAASQEDGTTLAQAQELQQAAPDSVYLLRSQFGAHNVNVWRGWLPQAYAWLSQQLSPVEPQA